MAWDDTQTGSDSITYDEWNNMVTDQKTRIVEAMTTRGDILVRDASNATNRLAIGTNNQVLTSDGTDISWAAAAIGVVIYEKVINGPIYTGTLGYFVVPDSLDGKSITEVRIGELALSTGSQNKVDVRKNGTASTNSIFTSDVEIEIGTSESATNGVYQTGCTTSGATVGTPGTTIDSGQNTLAADDIIYIIVTSAGSTTTGSDLKVEVIIE